MYYFIKSPLFLIHDLFEIVRNARKITAGRRSKHIPILMVTRLQISIFPKYPIKYNSTIVNSTIFSSRKLEVPTISSHTLLFKVTNLNLVVNLDEKTFYFA